MLTVDELKKREKKITARIKALPKTADGKLPVVDGIIDTEQYVKAKYKIVWVLKEVPHGNGNWSLNEALRDIQTPQGIFDDKKLVGEKMIMIASYCILKESISAFKNIRTDKKVLNALKSVAQINVKKFPGGATAIPKEIAEAGKKNSELLTDQINAYEADIVIFGNTLQHFPNEFFRENTIMSGPFGFGNRKHYYMSEKRLFINACHPSKPGLSEKEYAGNIFNAFANWKEKYKKGC